MSDMVDQGNDTAELFLEAALSKRKPSGPRPNGRCHNCGYVLTGAGQRWCDGCCRDEWERRSA